MDILKKFISKCKNHRGATAVIIAIVLIPLLGITILAIDVGYVAITKNELQNIADATVLAAVSQMGNNYVEQQSFNKDDIVSVVNEVAGKNKAGGEFITISDDDVILTKWPSTGGLSLDNAVTVTARRDDMDNNPITTFFAKIIGIDAVNVSASATAALTGLSKTFEVELPVGISREWFEVHGCNSTITFHGKADCAAWHCFSTSHCGGGKVKKLLEDIRAGTFESPEIIAGETEYSFSECGCGGAFKELEKLFEDRKDANGEWTTTIVVYDLGCREHHGGHKLATIIGFATITITDILVHEKEIEIDIEANFVCEYVKEGRGGGGEYGTYGSIPGLVE